MWYPNSCCWYGSQETPLVPWSWEEAWCGNLRTSFGGMDLSNRVLSSGKEFMDRSFWARPCGCRIGTQFSTELPHEVKIINWWIEEELWVEIHYYRLPPYPWAFVNEFTVCRRSLDCYFAIGISGVGGTWTNHWSCKPIEKSRSESNPDPRRDSLNDVRQSH